MLIVQNILVLNYTVLTPSHDRPHMLQDMFQCSVDVSSNHHVVCFVCVYVYVCVFAYSLLLSVCACDDITNPYRP